MKVPSLKAVYEFAMKRKSEAMAVKRPQNVMGYDKQLDDLYNEVEPETDGSDLMIHRIS